MVRPRAVVSVLLSYSLLLMSANGSTVAPMGTITAATSAHVGVTPASTGSTVFGGDHLSTERTGSMQIRAGAARLLLSGASSAALSQKDGAPGATLLSGTVVFSTANAKAFLLHASTADIRPQSDRPTVAQVTYVNDKELRVRATRGALAITVEDETQIVPEGTAYRVILDPSSYYASESPQGPAGAGAGSGRPPRKAGRSRFLLIAIIVTGVATGVALYEALQSPAKP
jgi:hypothetical protein